MKDKLPSNVIERLSRYRQTLAMYLYSTAPHISSSDLARIMSMTAENVRRDLMLIGCKATNTRKGFSISILIKRINEVLDLDNNSNPNIAIIGKEMNLTDILANHYNPKKINTIFVFDFDIKEVKENDGLVYYPLSMINEIIVEKNIMLAILNTSPDFASQICEMLTNSGVKGIINYTSVPLMVPSHIYLDEINPITVLEKAIYNIKPHHHPNHKAHS